MDLKNLLNKEQYEAAVTVDGPLLVLAGAGSGKTRVLTYRIAHMINDLNIYPSQILALTFTNKAAGEMKERIKSLVGDVVDGMWVSTFHSSCVRILRREIDKLGYNKNFTIYDSYDAKALIKQCMKELNINDKDLTEGEIINKISDAKNKLISAKEYKRQNEGNFRLNKIADVYLLYEKKLRTSNSLDFDDLIYLTVRLFKENEEAREFYRRKFKYILVDEYQDTNKCQYELVKLLINENQNICVVGDDDQCLVEGTFISTPSGVKKIEHLKEKEDILIASGNGEASTQAIKDINRKEYKGEIIKVTTEGGKILRGTPSHITFTRINLEEDKYYVYLMYKEGFGYRIGQTSSVRSRKNKNTSGLAVRLNGEQADKMWIIKVCSSKEDATYYEQYYSVKYGIPTVVFNSRGRNIVLSQEKINQMFREIDTLSAAEALMESEYLYRDYPHHLSNAVIRGDSIRKRVNITFFGGKKSLQRSIYSHRIGLNSSGEERKKFQEAGFKVRNGQRNTYRIETERASYDEAEEFARSLSKVDSFEVLRKAKLTEDKSFMFMPMGSLKEGMSLAIKDEDKIIEDKIVEVVREDYSGVVYDINVDSARNYIADDIVVHNCIYAWRGADINNILDFEKDFPSAKVIKLEQNYRSKGNILDAANSVIKNNAQRKSKVLRTDSEEGDRVRLYRAYSDIDEGNFVATQIKRIIKDENKNFKDFAILYRMNSQSRIFEEAFRRNEIPYKIVGGLRFYERKEIKDMMAYLKVINNPLDDISLKRIINEPKRSIGDTTVGKIQEFASENDICLYDALLDVDFIPGLSPRTKNSIDKFVSLMNGLMTDKENFTVSHLLEEILDRTGYMQMLKGSNSAEDESRIENLKELVSDAVAFENTSEDKTLSAFLEKVTLVSDIDNLEEENNAVVLMTVHSAKGLEFPVVFMVGMENGIFPGMASLNSFSEMEESRRLCYVAITRAREQLYISSAEQRMVFGRTVCYPVSDFLSEIPKDLRMNLNENMTAMKNSNRSSFVEKSNNPHSFRNNFFATKTSEGLSGDNGFLKSSSDGNTTGEVTMGRKVRHGKFGIGTVVSIVKDGSESIVTIAFDNMGIKKLMLSKAGLEVL